MLQVTGGPKQLDFPFTCGIIWHLEPNRPKGVRFTPDNDRKSGFPHKVMSALPPKADMCSAARDVRFGPKADIGNCSNPKMQLLRRVGQPPNLPNWVMFAAGGFGYFLRDSKYRCRRRRHCRLAR